MKQRLLVIASAAIRKHAGSLAKTSAIPQMQSQTHWPTSFDGSSKLDYGMAQPPLQTHIYYYLSCWFRFYKTTSKLYESLVYLKGTAN
jgi:hypothetical protein